MQRSIETVDLALEFEVHDVDALYEAAKIALAEMRAEAVAEHGENSEVLYAQPMDQLIKEHLHDPEGGEVHLASCVLIVLDRASWSVPGTELIRTAASSKRQAD